MLNEMKHEIKNFVDDNNVDIFDNENIDEEGL